MTLKIIGIVGVLAAGAPSAGCAQHVAGEPVGAVLAQMRSPDRAFQRDSRMAAERLLVGTGKRLSHAEMDSLIRGLTAIGIEGGQAGQIATSTFIAAGRASEGDRAKLVELALGDIFREGRDAGTRILALAGLGMIGPSQRTLALWEDVATSPALPDLQIGPVRAVEYLCEFGGQPGRSILLRLHRERRVNDRLAGLTLERMIRNNFTSNCGS